MSHHTQLMQYALLRVRVSRDDARGEVSATTIVWAAVLIGLAVTLAGVLKGKIEGKADTINLG